jgi:hypothetical protein
VREVGGGGELAARQAQHSGVEVGVGLALSLGRALHAAQQIATQLARPYRHLFPLPWPADFDRYH